MLLRQCRFAQEWARHVRRPPPPGGFFAARGVHPLRPRLRVGFGQRPWALQLVRGVRIAAAAHDSATDSTTALARQRAEALAKVEQALGDWADGGGALTGVRDQAAVQRASAFLERCQMQGGQPGGAAFYSALVGACSDCGEVAAARRLFEAAVAAAASGEAGLDPTELGGAYAHMCLVHCDQQQPAAARAVLDQAAAAGAELPEMEVTWVYSRLIHTFGRAKQLNEARAVFAELAAKCHAVGEQLPPVVYRRMIDACAAVRMSAMFCCGILRI